MMANDVDLASALKRKTMYGPPAGRGGSGKKAAPFATDNQGLKPWPGWAAGRLKKSGLSRGTCEESREVSPRQIYST